MNENEAPPKQLANALEGLSRAIRLIADVRAGADVLLEAFDTADSLRGNDPDKAVQCVASSVEATKRSLELLRSTAKELESAGVLIGAQQRYQDNQPWGLHMPLVCPDGAVVAYSWKRQIAGQAAASAVDRTRLALKSFCEQKKRFLPHIDSGSDCPDTVYKRAARRKSDLVEGPVLALPDVLKQIQEVAPGMSVVPRARSKDKVETENAAFLEVIIPGILRAIVSLLPTGSTNPDAVAIFSSDENQVDAWGASAFQVYRKIAETGTNALQYFVRMRRTSALMLLLQWLFSYRTLLSKNCRQCNRLLSLDPLSNVLLPPTFRAYRGLDASKVEENAAAAYHSGCAPTTNEAA